MEKNAAALLLTDSVAFPIGAALSAVRGAGEEAVSEDDVLVITQVDSQKGVLPVEASSVEVVVFVSKSPDLVGEQFLVKIGRVLKPGGKILVKTSLGSNDAVDKQMQRKMLLAGFVEVKAILPLKDDQSLMIAGKKASWTIGSSFSLTKVNKTLPKIQIDDDSDLIDEDSLLTEDDLKKPQLPVVGDCEVGSTRKACKNCTCGRAEAEEKVQKLGFTAEQINNPQSACGSCGLGDAFRCASCPYKGLPPFKLGEKVALPGNFLAADF